ncbi:MAG: hypothetical protein ABIC95_00990 [archaeon]
MTGRQDITSLFEKHDIKTEYPIVLTLTDHMYPVKEKLELNWLDHAIPGFREMFRLYRERGLPVKTITCTGSSNGLDGIILYHLAKEAGISPETIVITDGDERLSEPASKNVFMNIRDNNVRIIHEAGYDAEPLIRRGITTDVAYANIPHLPDHDVDTSMGIAGSTFQRWDRLTSPVNIDCCRYLLAFQYVYLESMKKVLEPGRMTMLNLGGRMPWEQMVNLFNVTGYRMEELSTSFKEQTEFEETAGGYAAWERTTGTEFEYYPVDKVHTLIEKAGVRLPITGEYGQELKNLIRRQKVSANDALILNEYGMKMGHTVHLLGAVRKE